MNFDYDNADFIAWHNLNKILLTRCHACRICKTTKTNNKKNVPSKNLFKIQFQFVAACLLFFLPSRSICRGGGEQKSASERVREIGSQTTL